VAKMTKAQKKVGKVMGEFKEGTLHSGKKGPVVKSRKQAIAIAMSEAGMKKPIKKAMGGMVNKGAKTPLKTQAPASPQLLVTPKERVQSPGQLSSTAVRRIRRTAPDTLPPNMRSGKLPNSIMRSRYAKGGAVKKGGKK